MSSPKLCAEPFPKPQDNSRDPGGQLVRANIGRSEVLHKAPAKVSAPNLPDIDTSLNWVYAYTTRSRMLECPSAASKSYITSNSKFGFRIRALTKDERSKR